MRYFADDVASAAAVLGLELAAQLFPHGDGYPRSRPPGADQAVPRQVLSAVWRVVAEVPLPNPGDPRTWDLVLRSRPGRWRGGRDEDQGRAASRAAHPSASSATAGLTSSCWSWPIRGRTAPCCRSCSRRWGRSTQHRRGKSSARCELVSRFPARAWCSLEAVRSPYSDARRLGIGRFRRAHLRPGAWLPWRSDRVPRPRDRAPTRHSPISSSTYESERPIACQPVRQVELRRQRLIDSAERTQYPRRQHQRAIPSSRALPCRSRSATASENSCQGAPVVAGVEARPAEIVQQARTPLPSPRIGRGACQRTAPVR